MTMDKEISDILTEAGLNIEISEIQTRIETLTKFKVPENEMKRSILNHFGAPKQQPTGDNEIGTVSQVDKDGMWTSLRVKVVQLWENNHDSINQTGIVGDPTGTVKFTSWASANVPEMEEGGSYTLYNVVSSIYNGKMQVSLNKKSRIEPTDPIEAKDNSTSFLGALVAIRNGSGLITRCSVCNKAMGSTCKDHIDGGSFFDVRIIGTLDNGVKLTSVIINAELVEQLTGCSIDFCTTLAAERLDKEEPGNEMAKMLLGKFFYVTGTDLTDTILAKTITPYVDGISDEDLKSLITYARGE